MHFKDWFVNVFLTLVYHFLSYLLHISADKKTENAIREQKRLVRQKLLTIPFDLQEDIVSLVVENPKVFNIKSFVKQCDVDCQIFVQLNLFFSNFCFYLLAFPQKVTYIMQLF